MAMSTSKLFFADFSMRCSSSWMKAIENEVGCVSLGSVQLSENAIVNC